MQADRNAQNAVALSMMGCRIAGKFRTPGKVERGLAPQPLSLRCYDYRRGRAGSRPVIYSLDVVPIGIDYERCIVTGVVFSFARQTVVATTGSRCGEVERVDLVAPAGLERQVNA